MLFAFTGSAIADVNINNLTIKDDGKIVFSDNSVQSTATSQGPQGTPGDTGFNALINTVNEPSGANCPTAGVKIQVGIDQNRNSLLDSGEVTQTKYVCNGALPQNANINGAWNWVETQFMAISGSCDTYGAVNSYTLSFVQNGNQLTVTPPQGAGIVSNSLSGTVTGSTIQITGGIQFDDGKSLQDIMHLIASEDGTTLSGTLFQSSNDTGICNGIFKINATKSP
jgi:hypothetical protein